jgi:hypothetical protein
VRRHPRRTRWPTAAVATAVGGTSVSAPLVAGICGLAGDVSSIIPEPKSSCGDSYLCVARKGYDAPTGLARRTESGRSNRATGRQCALTA